jgi:hypothetical protein
MGCVNSKESDAGGGRYWVSSMYTTIKHVAGYLCWAGMSGTYCRIPVLGRDVGHMLWCSSHASPLTGGFACLQQQLWWITASSLKDGVSRCKSVTARHQQLATAPNSKSPCLLNLMCCDMLVNCKPGHVRAGGLVFSAYEQLP